MKIYTALGNTGFIDAGSKTIPFYKTGGGVILIDSGSPRDAPELLRLLDDRGLEVNGVITTHAHTDHAGCNRILKERGARIAMPAFEAECFSSPQVLKAWYPLFTPNEILDDFGDIFFSTDRIIGPEDDSVTLCGVRFGVIQTPGHTPRHISVMTPDGVLCLADALMSREDCERAKLPYAFSIDLSVETADQLRGARAETYLLSHGGQAESIERLIDDNIACFERAAGRVLTLIDQPVTMDQAVEAVVRGLGIKSGTNIYKFRILERNVRVFVEYLVDHGKLEPRIEGCKLVYIKL